MSQEFRRVLNTLLERSRTGGVSVGYLSKHTGIAPERLLKILGLLERAGYVHVRRAERVELVALTRAGYQKAAARRRKRPRPPLGRFQVAGVALLIILIGFLWWWFDPFSATDGLKLASSAPLPSATLHPTSLTTPVEHAADAVNTPPGDGATAPASPTPAHIDTATSPPTDSPTPTASATPRPVLPSSTPTSTTPAFLSTAVPTPVPLLEQPEEAVNIVLMGTDTTQGSWRTDTLIVVSVDPRLPSVSMLSIPRDLYVYIPGWKMSRINTADFHGERAGYPGGGPGLVKTTIEYNLGVRVHYFARVDFRGFIELLDTLGGVDVVVDCELHDTFPDPDAEGGSTDIDLLPGVHHLDGQAALWYARSRWNTSDFDRGRRQQRVLRGALSKIKQLELLPQLPELWDDLIETVETDLPLETALWLAQVAGRMDAETAIKSRFIDNTVLQAWRTPEGAAVLLPRYERVGPLVAEALAPPETARTRQGLARVEVLNGTTWTDWAILAADRLAWEGFEVVHVGPAERVDYRQTTIVDMMGGQKGSAVDYLSRVLNVDQANVLPAETPDPEIDLRVIVGYDYRPCYKTYWRAVHAPGE